jgi:hypothetical protein
MLAQAGFKNVFNIVDGMEGDAVEDPDSVFADQRLKNGWKNFGCPWTYKLPTDGTSQGELSNATRVRRRERSHRERWLYQPIKENRNETGATQEVRNPRWLLLTFLCNLECRQG